MHEGARRGKTAPIARRDCVCSREVLRRLNNARREAGQWRQSCVAIHHRVETQSDDRLNDERSVDDADSVSSQSHRKRIWTPRCHGSGAHCLVNARWQWMCRWNAGAWLRDDISGLSYRDACFVRRCDGDPNRRDCHARRRKWHRGTGCELRHRCHNQSTPVVVHHSVSHSAMRPVSFQDHLELLLLPLETVDLFLEFPLLLFENFCFLFIY